MTNQNQEKQLSSDRLPCNDLSVQQQESINGGIGGNRSCIPPIFRIKKKGIDYDRLPVDL